jgi:putative membrane protein
MLSIKALHIIFIVTWFAGLFYIVRLFVYHSEAEQMEEPEKSILIRQYRVMEKRLWFGITWPSMVLAWFFGLWMTFAVKEFYLQPWFQVKLILVILLTAYHLLCHYYFRFYQRGLAPVGSNFMRIFNEIATLFLVSVVFLVELQHAANWLYGTLGLVLFSLILLLAIRIYRKFREGKKS